MNHYNLRLSFVARKIGSLGLSSHVTKRFEDIEAKDPNEAVEKARTLVYNDYEHVGMISASFELVK